MIKKPELQLDKIYDSDIERDLDFLSKLIPYVYSVYKEDFNIDKLPNYSIYPLLPLLEDKEKNKDRYEEGIKNFNYLYDKDEYTRLYLYDMISITLDDSFAVFDTTLIDLQALTDEQKEFISDAFKKKREFYEHYCTHVDWAKNDYYSIKSFSTDYDINPDIKEKNMTLYSGTHSVPYNLYFFARPEEYMKETYHYFNNILVTSDSLEKESSIKGKEIYELIIDKEIDTMIRQEIEEHYDPTSPFRYFFYYAVYLNNIDQTIKDKMEKEVREIVEDEGFHLCHFYITPMSYSLGTYSLQIKYKDRFEIGRKEFNKGRHDLTECINDGQLVAAEYVYKALKVLIEHLRTNKLKRLVSTLKIFDVYERDIDIKHLIMQYANDQNMIDILEKLGFRKYQDMCETQSEWILDI